MRTLIVGCGYVGLRVAARLIEAGDDVLAVTRSTTPRPEWVRLGIAPVVADVLRPETLAALPGVDRVYYAVGYDRAGSSSKRSVYVDGLANVLSALQGEVRRFVYASSTSVYGQDDGGWVDEASLTEPETESGRTCLDAEAVATAWSEERSVPLTVLRYSGLYGPVRVVGRSALENARPIDGDPDAFLNLIHADDAAAAAVSALRGDGDGLYLASDDRPLPRREYYTLAALLLRTTPPVFSNTGAGGSGKRVSNRRLKQEIGLRLSYPDVGIGLPSALSG